MPIYEYECRACNGRFEALVRGTVVPVCPSCQSADLARIISMFGVNSAGTRQANLQAGKKHQAKANRDKVVADHEAAHHHH